MANSDITPFWATSGWAVIRPEQAANGGSVGKISLSDHELGAFACQFEMVGFDADACEGPAWI